MLPKRRLGWTIIAFHALTFSTAATLETEANVTFALENATIEEINAAFDADALTSVQLVKLYLARIQAYDDQGPSLNAVLVLNPEALQTAARLDAERNASGPRSPMHGIPILVKDNYNTVDLPTTAGSVALAGSIPDTDAFVVRRFREAGAIILGKVNMSEFATPAGRGSYSSLNGVTRNPYNLLRDPAGSSGGTGASIAANFATIGLGTDTGGSIRGPAAANGLVGIRATFGLISRHGVIPQALSLDVPGPMGRNVTDVAIALGIMAGADLNDPTTLHRPRNSHSDYTQFLNADALRGARIGVARDFFGGNAAVDALIEAAIKDIRAQGAIVIDSIAFAPEFHTFRSGLRADINAEFQPNIEAYLATLSDEFPKTLAELITIYESPEVRSSASPVNPGLIATHQRNLTIGGLDNPAYVDAIEIGLPRVRNTLLRIMDQNDLDALVYPTARCPARPLYTADDPTYSCLRGHSGTTLASYSGFPDIQVPAGFTPDGLPTTISFVGRPFLEPELIGFAFDFEQATAHWRLSSLVPALPGTTVS